MGESVTAIVDTKPLLSGALPPSECCRPGLHEFLELCVDGRTVEVIVITILWLKQLRNQSLPLLRYRCVESGE